jgi:hypothetical protein
MALRRHRGLLLAAALLAAGALTALADSAKQREFGLTKVKEDKTILVSVDYTDIFDDKAEKKLSSGLPTTVLMRLYLKADKKKKPVSMRMSTCKVLYDVWEEHYIVTVSTEGSNKTKKLDSKKEAVKLCGSVKKLPFPVKDVPGGVYRFAVVVDLNPLSKEVLEAMRKWLKRPLGDTGHLNPADSFFGSFIAIFVNEKIEPSEKTIKFESQKFKIAF